MADEDIRIVELQPMRVAVFHAESTTPELDAWKKLSEWAKTKRFRAPSKKHRLFGFNNPDPSGDKPEYGYEAWVALAGAIIDTPGPEPVFKNFPGGRYAVLRVKGIPNVRSEWKRLVRWRKKSDYNHGRHQWLEEHLTNPDLPLDEIVLDLYLPIAKKRAKKA